MSDKQKGTVVAKISKRAHVTTGKPRRVVAATMMSKVATCSFGGGGGGGGGGLGMSGGFGVGQNTVEGRGGNWYSPELSTDFLELPQSLDEMRAYYRFFYQNDPFVGQAIDIHTEIPLSRVRLGIPKAKNKKLALKSWRFCTKWIKRVGLLQRLLEIVHEYHTLGEVFIWAEDPSPDEPEELRYEVKHIITEDGEAKKEMTERPDADERHFKWLQKNYKGWDRVTVLPPEQIHMESFPFTQEKMIELVLDGKTRSIIEEAKTGNPRAEKIVDSIPKEIVAAAENGTNIPLNTDPYAGSFVHYLARKRSPYQPRGHSILQRCIRTLVHKDKLRQANASIASRHMTPIRVVTAEDADANDIEELRDQVDLALIDPDYSIVANYQIQWEEMGSDQRLLDLGGHFDLLNREMYAGLGVTESLLSGESTYSGDRINLEVLNTRYMLLRETLQDFVEEFLLRPMCHRMGFIELDEDGDEVILVPALTFTRMALRDNNDIFDTLFNLYQKGSLDVETIYDLLNLDSDTITQKLMNDLWTPRDANFNEALRSVYSRSGDTLAEKSNAAEKIAETLGLEMKEEEEGGDRFS